MKKRLIASVLMLSMAGGAAMAAEKAGPAASPNVGVRTVTAPPAAALKMAPKEAAEEPVDPNVIVCDPYVSFAYVQGLVRVFCTPEGGGTYVEFLVTEGDKLSPEGVVAFLQPYAMAVKILQSMPSVGVATMTPFQSFNQRVRLYVENGKILGMQTVTHD